MNSSTTTNMTKIFVLSLLSFHLPPHQPIPHLPSSCWLIVFSPSYSHQFLSLSVHIPSKAVQCTSAASRLPGVINMVTTLFSPWAALPNPSPTLLASLFVLPLVVKSQTREPLHLQKQNKNMILFACHIVLSSWKKKQVSAETPSQDLSLGQGQATTSKGKICYLTQKLLSSQLRYDCLIWDSPFPSISGLPFVWFSHAKQSECPGVAEGLVKAKTAPVSPASPPHLHPPLQTMQSNCWAYGL